MTRWFSGSVRGAWVLFPALLAFSATTLAQPLYPGAAFPLTNTRYTVVPGRPAIVSDGRHFFLFWSSGPNIRMTKLVDGEARGGRAVMTIVDPFYTDTNTDFDVVWTGRHFFIAATIGHRIKGQLVSATGEPMGPRLELETFSELPRLAFNGTHILLVMHGGQTRGMTHATVLTAEGLVLTRMKQLLPPAPSDGSSPYLFKIDLGVTSNGDGFALLVAREDGDRLLMLDGNGALRSVQHLREQSVSATIASDGRGYRAAGVTRDGRTWSFGIDASGSVGQTLTLDDAVTAGSIVWSRGRYTASFTTADGQVRVVEIDSTGTMVRSDSVILDMPPRERVRLAASPSRVLAVWKGERMRGVLAADLPLTHLAGSPVTFAAAGQELLATAASAGAALVVWSESGSLRAGARSASGAWSESFIAFDGHRAMAASDGREFVVLYYGTREQWFLVRLDETARPLAPPLAVTATLVPYGLVWNGESYTVIGMSLSLRDTAITAAKLTLNGVMSAAVTIEPSTPGSTTFLDNDPAIAWNGETYLAIWKYQLPIVSNYFVPIYAVEGTRVSPNLERLDSTNVLLTHVHWSVPSVTWDGAEFVVAYNFGLRKMSRTGVAGSPLTLSGSAERSLHASGVDGGVVLAWRDASFIYRVAAMSANETTLRRESIVLRSYWGGEPRVVALPGGRAAVVTSSAVDAPPHHGSVRLLMSVLDHATPAPPSFAPRVTVQVDGAEFRIEWTALPETVTGYRVEYRIGDGNWNEIERSPDPAVRTATFRRSGAHSIYAFRVRAMSDGGMGPYSDPAIVYLSKRRSAG